jgi:TonB family protein
MMNPVRRRQNRAALTVEKRPAYLARADMARPAAARRKTAGMATCCGAKISALVKIRIEKDGRVSKFEIVRPSGNVVVDESIAAVAKRVTQVDSLPNGLGNGEHYDVNINFELNSDQ